MVGLFGYLNPAGTARIVGRLVRQLTNQSARLGVLHHTQFRILPRIPCYEPRSVPDGQP